MKKFYLSLFAVLVASATVFATDSSAPIDENCAPDELNIGGSIIPNNSLYAITFVDAAFNFGRFSYFPESDGLFYDAGAALNIAMSTPFAMDYNPADGLVYAILDNGSGTRNFHILDPVSGSITDLGAVVSSSGATNPSAMAIDSDGVVYITFGSGAIETYNPGTGVATFLGTLPAAGGAGLTYDFDNDRLIYGAGTSNPSIWDINPDTGAATFLFNITIPGASGSCTAQAVQYVGNNKAISSSTFDCGIIYTIDLVTGATVSLADPNPFDGSVKQFAYINASTPSGPECNDATVEVQSDLSIPFNGGTVTNAINNLYAIDLNATGGINDVHLYNYDPLTDDISVKTPVVTSTGTDQFFAMDYHPIENQVYILQNNASARSLFTFDLDTGATTLIDAMVSPLGDVQAQDMTFGSDGALYVTFQSGEIGLYDLSTGTMNAFADVGTAGTAGGVGLTYDFENSRLLHASGTANIDVNAISLADASVSFVVSFTVPDGGCGGTSQGIEYVGGNKVVSSTTFGCDTVYTVDLDTGVAVAIRNPAADDGFDVRIKDLMYIGMDVSLSPAAFVCDDIGVNTVDVTITDYAGNVYNCTATVTIEDPNNFCGLSVDEFDAAQVVMYPNPAGDELQIQWNANEPLEAITIFDITGKQVLNLELNQQTGLSVDVSELATGLYLVKFQSSAGTAVQRLIKQ
ncbi:T9SS type A sorting domain-containing protein [Gilvibacter sp.]|uniref:T9SS type A sorting domain-containing protein n=1 Tax=Gilvibacter sp. TaxID=2729997 RepID=UPI003B52F890